MFSHAKFQNGINICCIKSLQCVRIKPHSSTLTNLEHSTRNFRQSLQICCGEKVIEENNDNCKAFCVTYKRNKEARNHTFMTSTRKGYGGVEGGKVLKFVMCLWIISLLNNRSTVYFFGWRGWGSQNWLFFLDVYKCMTLYRKTKILSTFPYYEPQAFDIFKLRMQAYMVSPNMIVKMWSISCWTWTNKSRLGT